MSITVIYQYPVYTSLLECHLQSSNSILFSYSLVGMSNQNDISFSCIIQIGWNASQSNLYIYILRLKLSWNVNHSVHITSISCSFTAWLEY